MEGTIGQILLFAGDYEPKHWMFCDGQALEVYANQALFSVIKNNHGGDGVHDFNLPKIDPPNEHMKYIICVDGVYPMRHDY